MCFHELCEFQSLSMLIQSNTPTAFSHEGEKSSAYVADFPVKRISPLSEFDFLSTLGSEQSREIKTLHSEIIYDISFDSQKRRLATCSADQTVLIWTLDDCGQWVHDSTIREHGGSSWKVSFNLQICFTLPLRRSFLVKVVKCVRPRTILILIFL